MRSGWEFADDAEEGMEDDSIPKAEREALAKVESGEDQEQVLKDAVAVLEAFMGGREFYVIAMEIGQGALECTALFIYAGGTKARDSLASPLRGSLRNVGSGHDVPKSGYLTSMIY